MATGTLRFSSSGTLLLILTTLCEAIPCHHLPDETKAPSQTTEAGSHIPLQSQHALASPNEAQNAGTGPITRAPVNLKRQEEGVVPAGFAGYLAPDTTCGYPLAKDSPRFVYYTTYSNCQCAVSLTLDNVPIIGCCASMSCEWRLPVATCIPYYEGGSTACKGDTACSPETQACDLEESPYCKLISFVGPWGAVERRVCTSRSLNGQPITYTAYHPESWQSFTNSPSPLPEDHHISMEQIILRANVGGFCGFFALLAILAVIIVLNKNEWKKLRKKPAPEPEPANVPLPPSPAGSSPLNYPDDPFDLDALRLGS